MMTVWEYRIISLPAFEDPTASSESSAAVTMLNEQGERGWEAVSMTVLLNGHVAVLLKRPQSGS